MKADPCKRTNEKMKRRITIGENAYGRCHGITRDKEIDDVTWG